MSLNPQFIPVFWLLLGASIYAWVLFKAIRAAQWWRLHNHRDFQVLLFAMAGTLFIWTMKADFTTDPVTFGLNLHLLGATLLTMMFGWAFAILAMSLVILVFTLIFSSEISSLYSIPWNVLLTSVLPVFISYYLFRFTERYLPNNFFIYIFIGSFFSAALAMASVILSTTGFHYLSGAYSYEYLSYNYLPYGLLLMFPEAFITGMLMSIFVAYRPHWVSTFDDRKYLQNH